MTITYCRDDSVGTPARWTGVNRLLTEYEVDYNFYQHDQRLTALEADVTVNVSVSSITQPTANTLLFTMSDASTQGPFTLPSATFRDRGEWAATTSYLVNDTFSANGALYRALVDHTSDGTFSPTANDGAGHDYYAAMLSSPGNSLPTGGATAQVLQKSSGSDFSVSWGYKLPTGGTTGQVLTKASNTNQDAAWTIISASMIGFTPSTSSSLTADNVADAIEQAALLGSGGGGASALSDLTDVSVSTGQPSYLDILQFDGDFWTPVPVTAARNTVVTDITSSAGHVNIDADLGDIFRITPTEDTIIDYISWATGADVTLQITTSGTTSYSLSAGSHVKMQGSLASGTVSGKTYILKFISVAGNLYEASRTTAM